MNNAKTLTRGELRRAAGRRIICGFAGVNIDAELREIVREIRPLGVILFARNIESPEQVAELIRELKCLEDRRNDPLLVSVDQEGGRVARVRSPATEWPAMRDIARLGDPALVRQVGHALGSELCALGFDLNYAPVLDINTNPQNPIIGDRAFGDDPHSVARFAVEFLHGLNSAGVAGCGKHFPGHGDTDTDSHLALPRLEHELPLIREREWAPFRAAIGAGLDAMMTAHVLVTAIDESVPATLSPAVIRCLREELGFGGVIVSDDVEMKALADHYEPDEIAARGVEAGLDVFLTCDDYAVTMDTYRGIVQRFEQDAISHESIALQEKRVLSWRARWAQPPSLLNRAEIGRYSALAEEISQRLATG